MSLSLDQTETASTKAASISTIACRLPLAYLSLQVLLGGLGAGLLLLQHLLQLRLLCCVGLLGLIGGYSLM